jgi:O-antigen ligase
MKKIELQKTLALIFIIVAVELWSFIVFSFSTLTLPVFIFFGLIFLGLSWYRPQYGLLIILAELIIGSMGHLFFLDLGSLTLSIRTLFWLLLLLIFIVKLLGQVIRNRQKSVYLQNILSFKALKYFLLLAVFILISLLNAYFKGQSLGQIFSDFNAWLFFLLIFPVVAVFDFKDKAFCASAKIVLTAAVLWLSLKTLLFLFVFTHDLSFAPEIYSWLRRTLVGEMTPTLSGFPRVFLQSQIFSAMAYLIFFWLGQVNFKIKEIFKRQNIYFLILAALFLSAVIISFSRSFWLAFLLSAGVSGILLWCAAGFKKALNAVLWLMISGALSFLLIYLVVAFPYFNFKGASLNAGLVDRVSAGSGEAALASRWSLLPVLWSEIKREPFLGQGFGATVTYFSRDPRVLENNPTGEYTTAAFEWGYLDIWLKLGLFGLLAYFFLLWQIAVASLRRGFKEHNHLFLGIFAALLFLAVVNAFTPYLNHPLGIGFLLLASCLIWKNKVY